VAILPWMPKAMVYQVAKRYVAGETLKECVATVKALNARGCRATIDLLGEFIVAIEEAHTNALAYKDIIKTIAQEQLNANISIKLSALGLLISPKTCQGLVDDLCFYAREYNCFIRLDMEDSRCTQPTIDIYLALREKYPNVGIVLQAYLKRTLGDVSAISKAGAGNYRLCKGIYLEPPETAYTDRTQIQDNYQMVLEHMFDKEAFVGIATHDPVLIEGAKRAIADHQMTTTQYEFQMLLGVAEGLRESLLKGGHLLRVYVPYGQHWHGYCMRRLKENPKLAGYILSNFFNKNS
jgi:proline dehydrogenase